jgi:type II secretory pathway pseudopilin PulG
LVELVVVMGIVTMLAGLLLPALMGARNRARESVCANNLRQLGLGGAAYEGDYQYMPLTTKYWDPATPFADYADYHLWTAAENPVTAQPEGFVRGLGHLMEGRYIRDPRIYYEPEASAPSIVYEKEGNVGWECPGGAQNWKRMDYTPLPMNLITNYTYRNNSGKRIEKERAGQNIALIVDHVNIVRDADGKLAKDVEQRYPHAGRGVHIMFRDTHVRWEEPAIEFCTLDDFSVTNLEVTDWDFPDSLSER